MRETQINVEEVRQLLVDVNLLFYELLLESQSSMLVAER